LSITDKAELHLCDHAPLGQDHSPSARTRKPGLAGMRLGRPCGSNQTLDTRKASLTKVDSCPPSGRTVGHDV
jgi:hypothetical protein